MAYVYRHRRLDTNRVFYVGISDSLRGGTHRANNKSTRNNIWKKIVNKTNYSVEIIAEDIDLEDAKELEIFLIYLYGRIDLGTGTLSNMTDGGDGATKPSEEAMKKRNLITSETKSKSCVSFESGIEYKSLKSACNILGINYDWQKQAVRNQSPTALFYYKENPFTLRTTKYKETTIRKATTAKPVISFKSGKNYPSLREGCRQENLNYSAELTAINRQYTTANFYFEDEFFKLKTKEEVFENKIKILREKENRGEYRGRKVEYLITKEIYPNLRVACEKLNLKLETERARIKRNTKNKKFNYI